MSTYDDEISADTTSTAARAPESLPDDRTTDGSTTNAVTDAVTDAPGTDLPGMPERIVVPDTLAADPNLPLPRWPVTDYLDIAIGSGAAKLASSAVAPLVAAARGYDSVDESNLREKARRWGCGQTNTREGLQLAAAVGTEDALILPWYRPADVYRSAAGLDMKPVAAHAVFQMRPSNPEHNAKGKDVKYRFLAGSPTTVDIHPAVPAEWMTEGGVPVVLITEGTPKGDAALTAILRNYGFTDDELRFTPDPGVSDQREAAALKLRDMLSQLPFENRVLIVNLAGVGNWHQHTEWNSMPFNGADAWLAFDGDVAENPNVWSQAKQMFAFLEKRNATPVLLNLDVAPELPSAETEVEKIGLDDYLAQYGSWMSLEDRLEETLPPEPHRQTEYREGEWRIDGERLVAEEYVKDVDPQGNARMKWETRAGIVGRVARVETRRELTREEQESGLFDRAASESASGTCEIEISWKDRTGGENRSATLSGPDTLLVDPPKEWHRRGGSVPAAVGVHPDWPPRKGDDWMSAVKRWKEEETEHSMAWDHMGWVTVPDSTPVFITGKTVIGPEGYSDKARPGVGENELPKATWFGAALPDNEEQARQDLRAVLDAYVHREPWTDRRVAATVLATALRPCVPLPSRMSIFVVGPPRGGKALPMDALLPVPVSVKFPTGWARNEQIEVGDLVYAADGTATKVRGLSQVWHDEDVYEMTLSDGQVVRASGNHVMPVSTHDSRGGRAWFDAHPARAREAVNAGRAADLRAHAATLKSGDAATLTDLATLTGETYTVLWNLVHRVGIPSQAVAVTNAEGHSYSQRIYPVAEVLLAVAEKWETGGKCNPVIVSRSVAKLAQTITPAIAYALPLTEAVTSDDADADLLVVPYTLGVWLGDCTSREGSITCADPEIIEQIEADGYEVSGCSSGPIAYTIHGLMPQLRTLGLLSGKHIPADYLRASAAQRLALLQGIVDTDGSVAADGGCEITFTNERLAKDTLELVRSLGIRASIRSGDACITEHGERRVVGTRYRVSFTSDQPVARLPRKAANISASTKANSREWLYIRDIRKVEQVPTRCLTVEHPTGCFLVDGFVVTHNSWTANAIMSFHQPKAGVWQDRLPGSAKDSVAAMTNAVSRSILWVADDLAPNASKAKAERESSALGDMFRVILNGVPPARANADGSARKMKHPRALFIATAENALSVSSEMERVVLIQIKKGSLGSEAATARVNEIRDVSGEACRVTGAVLQMLAQDIADFGWRQTQEKWRNTHANVAHDAKQVLGGTGTATRHASISADVALGLMAGRMLAQKLNMGSETEQLFDQMITDVHNLVSEHHSAQRETTPGRRIIDAVRSILSAGHAHLSAPGQSGPPFVNVPDQAALNHMSGWSSGGDGAARGGGPHIGYVVFPEDGDLSKAVVLLHATNAFTEARRVHEDLVPSGSSANTAWTSLWDEGLTSHYWSRKTAQGGRKLAVVRARDHGLPFEGVPVPVSVLFDTDTEPVPDADEEYVPDEDD